MRELLEPYITRYVPWYREVMAVPAVRGGVELSGFLLGVSGTFWLLTRLSGRVALGIEKSLDRALADLFVVVYNIALALLFSSVLVQGIYVERGAKDDFLYYQAAGVALVYLVLSTVYAEKSGKIGEHALPGFWAGVIGYVVFCVKSQYLANPVTPVLYKAIAWIMKGWAGKLLAVLTLLQLLWRGLRLLARSLSSAVARLTPQRRTS